MNQTIQNDEVLTKSFFLEVMQGINKRLDKIEKTQKEHTKILNEHTKKLDEQSKKLDKHDLRLNEHDGNFRRIYDAIEDLSIRIEQYREENKTEHAFTRREMDGHFDHIYSKLNQYDDEWACINAWISRQNEQNNTFRSDINLIKVKFLPNN